MPTYDYECRQCGHRFDQFQNMSDDPLSVCPSCGEDALKRLVGGGIGVIFKGSGFYVNDSKSSGASKKSAAKTTGESSAPSESPGTGSGGDSSAGGSTGSEKSSSTAGKTASAKAS